MALEQKDIEIMTDHIRKAFPILREFSSPDVATLHNNNHLLERMIRVEEELRHQREILEKMMYQMDKRFEQMEKRFEQMEKRFEQVEKCFAEAREDAKRRSTSLQWMIGIGFTTMTTVISIVVSIVIPIVLK